jgi:putative flippase GtrA
MTGRIGHLASFLRFLMVGGSFSLGYAVLTTALINFAGASPLVTSVVVYLVCIPLAFLAQRRFAFGQSSNGRYGLLIYTATQVACLTFVATIASRFVSYDFWLDTALYLFTAGIAAVASYLICRFIIFRSPRDGAGQ